MNRWKNIFFCIIFLLLFAMPIQAELSGEFRIQLGGDVVDGNEARSSLEEGFNYTADLRLYLTGFLGENMGYFSYLDLRQSTDIMMERDDSIQLKRLQLELTRDENIYRLGHLYTDLGRYFFNQRYSGVDLTQKLGPIQLTGLVGERNPAEEGIRYARYNYGVRLRLPALFGGRTMLSVVTATTFDHADSIKNPVDDPLTNTVQGVILQTGFFNVGLQGSMALSNREEGVQSVTGESYLLQGEVRFNRILLSGGFEQVSPYFASVSGTAVPDRNTFNLRLRARVSEPLDVDLRYSQYHNNLEGQLLRTTTTKAPRLQFSISPPEYQGIRITGWATSLNRTSDDKGVHNDELTLGLRYLQRIQLLTLEVGVEQTYLWDHMDDSKDESGTSYITTLRGRYPFEDFVFMPGLVLSLREQDRDGKNIISPLFQVEMGVSRDRETVRLTYSRRYQDEDGVRDSGRDSLSSSIGYQVTDNQDIELSFTHSNYYFLNSANDYKDNRFKVTFRYRF